ncbi:hypothetical protein EI546_03675 [Aequorivita sp. H23M31]|uniref:Uncharacterized protein n=1 Tax=Aequorivita ciconiae TaxID=2494375 RepID=A0A410G0T3_9FLAO|nr:hypothetical protein [Aequorivita sp. H23M31]QAA80883.1 hypothetical protein EI546_03675 [Aequorivita sp. H23M31]
MKNYTWKFEQHQEETSTIVGFIHNAIQNFAKNPIQSIVREGIQNSSDALDDTAGHTQVKVIIRTGEVAKDEIPNLRDIEDHLRICKSRDNNSAENKEIQRHLNHIDNDKFFYQYIEVSDYNTKGMDPKSFLYFTQGDFKSHKDDPGSQGSKGVGKAAYFASSALRTMIISSKSDEGLRFRGTSRISTHKSPLDDSQKLKYQGYFGTTDVVDEADVPLRFRRYEKGTSIFILGSWQGAGDFKKKVITEVLRNYWFAVATDQLLVEVEDEVISSENLEVLMTDHFPSFKDHKTGLNQNPRPYYETYNKGMRYNERIPNIGECSLWLYKNDEFNLGAVARFRKTKMLIYKEDNLYSGYAGVFLCDDPKGNVFLKDIENEAHDEWNPNINPERKADARETIRAIKDFITESFGNYAGVDDSDSFGLDDLNEIFSFTERTPGSTKDNKPDAGPKKSTPDPDPEPRDRLISHHKFSVKQKGGEYIYDVEFTSSKTIRKQKIKFSIATESSRDSVEIVELDEYDFENDTVIIDVKKGENSIRGIKFSTPYLVAPAINSIK